MRCDMIKHLSNIRFLDSNGRIVDETIQIHVAIRNCFSTYLSQFGIQSLRIVF